MGWFFLLLILAVLLAPLVWAMFRVSRMRFEDPSGEIVGVDQVPEDVLLKLKRQVEPLIGSGFEYLGMRLERRGEGDYWQTFLQSAGGMVWAVAEEGHDSMQGRQVSLLSFDGEGSVALTRDGEGIFGAEEAGVEIQCQAYESALAQAESHAALLVKTDMSVVPVEPEDFLSRYQRLAHHRLDSFFDKEWLVESAEKEFQVPLAKLPLVALSWLKFGWSERARNKANVSWLLESKIVESVEPELKPEVESESFSEEARAEAVPVLKESLMAAEEQEESLSLMDEVAEPAERSESLEPVPVVGEVASGLDEATLPRATFTASAKTTEGTLVAAMPIGAAAAGEVLPSLVADAGVKALTDEMALVTDEESTKQDPVVLKDEILSGEVLTETKDKTLAEKALNDAEEKALSKNAFAEDALADEIVAPDPEVDSRPPIPEEDGLPRDMALYQKQSSQKSWAYWFGGFASRTLLFVTLFAFAVWMAQTAGWGLQIVLFGFIALLVHEAGHAILMLLQRSWDWSQFLIPFPRAMKAKQWPVKGGWGELLTILAGPVPGLVFGWAVVTGNFLNGGGSDLLLDFAVAAIVVNGVTLLPFLPLDGGRLLDLAFLRKAPQLRTVSLVFLGLALLALAFVGGGLLVGLLAILAWAGIPSSLRRSKLLPWFRANAKDVPEQQVLTAFSISRERSQRKSFRGAGGIAKLDELMGLAHAKSLGFFGAALVVIVFFLAAVAPLALSGPSVASSLQKTFDLRERTSAQAQEFLGELRPVRAGISANPEKEAEKEADALADLSSWQDRLARNPTDPAAVFSNELELNAARGMNWRMAAHWIAESPEDRHFVARAAAKSLHLQAIQAADNGDEKQAFRDLSVALRVIIECEPRHSLEAWVAWFELEREVIEEVEDVSSRYSIDDSYVKWYESALAQCPRPTPKKIAGLLLVDTQDLESLAKGFSFDRVLTSSKALPPGQRFVATLKGVGDIVSVEELEEKESVAHSFADASSLSDAIQQLQANNRLPIGIDDSLHRIGNHFLNRQIAISALKVKRVGMQGATAELAQLRKDYGYTARLDQTNDRKSLKLSRLDPAGELIEREWLLQQ